MAFNLIFKFVLGDQVLHVWSLRALLKQHDHAMNPGDYSKHDACMPKKRPPEYLEASATQKSTYVHVHAHVVRCYVGADLYARSKSVALVTRYVFVSARELRGCAYHASLSDCVTR